jgi:serine-type D-Ala-D-Ala carboxypeptidase (penicillin-binding protein 5/6)
VRGPRVALILLAASGALGPAGCGGGPATDGSRPAAAAGRHAVVRPLQVANGPVDAQAPARAALTLRLAATQDRVHARLGRLPRAGLLFDLDTGEVLWRRNPTRRLAIASLTKMMTALLVSARTEPGDRARITREALNYTGSGMGVLREGRRVPVQTLLHGLLLPSGNDAAIALALRVSGSQRAFVARMNERAAQMGLACTRFASPSGIVDRGNHSCAADLARLARAVLDDRRLAPIVRRRRVILPFRIKGGHIFLFNHNPLVRLGYPGVLGVKTGYTRVAGRCLVAAARRGGRRLGVVLLRSPDPGRQARRLLDAGFRVRS